jgi:alpha/beta superfamily hydrolase
MMTPLFFGPAEEPLYGVCHPADPAVERPLGAVLCPPLLHESDDAHRALRALADRLAAAGISTLRFDYLGTGDSAGSGHEASVERWTRDVALAVDELKASRGLVDVGLIGLRFGANLAVRAAEGCGELPFLVLWEPILDGRAYADSLVELQSAWVDYESRERPGARTLATPDEVMGHPLPATLRHELASVDLTSCAPPAAARAVIVDEGEVDGLEALATRFAAAGRPTRHQRADGGRIWRREFDSAQAQVPRELLASLVEWVCGEDGS